MNDSTFDGSTDELYRLLQDVQQARGGYLVVAALAGDKPATWQKRMCPGAPLHDLGFERHLLLMLDDAYASGLCGHVQDFIRALAARYELEALPEEEAEAGRKALDVIHSIHKFKDVIDKLTAPKSSPAKRRTA